jgi:hypothetical protein
MKTSLRIFLLAICLSSFGVNAQVAVYKLTSATKKPEKNGVMYSLPRTMIKVNVTVSETEFIKGPYAEYAADLLGIQNPVMQSYKEYELADVFFEALTEPDPDQYYFIEVDEKASKEDRNLVFSFSNNGIIKSVNTSGQIKERSGVSSENTRVITDEKLFELATTPSIYRKVDTIIRVVTVDTATIKKRFFNTTFEEKPSEMKAREAADMVSRIRDSRFNLLTGYQETNFSKESLEYMDKQLQTMSNEYLSLFRGLKTEKLLTFTYYIVPDVSRQTVTVCRISKEAGISDATDTRGKELVLQVKRSENTTQLPAWVGASLDPKIPVVFYRLPEMASLSVKYGTKLYDEKYLPVAQFGKVSQLPLNKARMEFYPETGSVKTVYFE